MHEMGIAQELVRIALESIPEDIQDPKVETINLKIGKLAAVVEHSLTFCFEILVKETPLEGARLEISQVPVRIRCEKCSHEWEVDHPVFQCPECSDGEVRLLTGREIEITSIELA
jgi:hydrogenase nickel incorporation protein HypA/HybF